MVEGSMEEHVKSKEMVEESTEGYVRSKKMVEGLIEEHVMSKKMAVGSIEAHVRIKEVVAGLIEGLVRSKKMVIGSIEGHIDFIVVRLDRKVVIVIVIEGSMKRGKLSDVPKMRRKRRMKELVAANDLPAVFLAGGRGFKMADVSDIGYRWALTWNSINQVS